MILNVLNFFQQNIIKFGGKKYNLIKYTCSTYNQEYELYFISEENYNLIKQSQKWSDESFDELLFWVYEDLIEKKILKYENERLYLDNDDITNKFIVNLRKLKLKLLNNF